MKSAQAKVVEEGAEMGEPSPGHSGPAGSLARSRKRDLVSIDDFSNEEILELFRIADEMRRDVHAWSHLCGGFILASLFYEASTRTRLSFESAMGRLGGKVISAPDMAVSSVKKGESLADTVRVVGGSYSDLIVLRHPNEGAARVAAQYADVPVINAGDGSHEHPTQTLCDLYSLYVEKGHLDELEVVLVGDLKYSRTVHSFAYALARFRSHIVCVPHPGLEIPDYVLERLQNHYQLEPQNVSLHDFNDVSKGADVVYCTPRQPHQLSLFTEARELDVPRYDALYVTRPQTERFHGNEIASDPYPRIEPAILRGAKFNDTSLMHPLPRLNEIAYEMDDDPRAIYFKQAARGVPVRMALLALLLGRASFKSARPPERSASEGRVCSGDGGGLRCLNQTCISNTEGDYLRPLFIIEQSSLARVWCAYCECERPVSYIGCASSKCYYRHNSPRVKRIAPQHIVLFGSEEEACSSGYRAAQVQ